MKTNTLEVSRMSIKPNHAHILIKLKKMKIQIAYTCEG